MLSMMRATMKQVCDRLPSTIYTNCSVEACNSTTKQKFVTLDFTQYDFASLDDY